MKRTTGIIAASLAYLLLSGHAASAITIDGRFGLSEWAGSYASDDGVGAGGYVGPGWGGQAFDVEYLGLRIENARLYFGLQTGFNLASGVTYGGTYYRPGDFALDVNNDGSYDYAIDFSISSGNPAYRLYDVSSWQHVKYTQHYVADPFQYSSGTLVSTFGGAYGSGVFSNNRDGGASYVLDGSFDTGLMSRYYGGPIKLHWTMECGNDYLVVSSAPVR